MDNIKATPGMRVAALTTGSTFFSENIQKFIKEAKKLRESKSIVERNLLFALKVASNMSNSKYTVDDLLSPALEGLIEAEKRYDPKKAKFTTWSYFKIREKILLYIESNKITFEEFSELPCENEPVPRDSQYTNTLLSYLQKTERELIFDRFYKGFGYQDLSEKYKITGAGLKGREKKILEKLRLITEKI